jgi:predicted N-formylglutamate amidohydrolase
MPDRRLHLIFTCEHASNRVPREFQCVADRARSALQTHRGYDPGAAQLARHLAKRFGAPLALGKWSRLLIELNRSPHHPQLWSEFSRSLPATAKRKLLETYYQPFRDTIEAEARRFQNLRRRVLHLSIHSFSPRLDGETRRADLGLLYDPGRRLESKFCETWKRRLNDLASGLNVRMNYPYRGVADGLTAHLRKHFPKDCYVGIELEVNQKFPTGTRTAWRKLMNQITVALELAIAA